MAADWWSVGVMIYEMLRGVPCFHGDDLKQTYQRVLYGEVKFLPENKFSSAAMELISGLLHRDPRQRLGSSPTSPHDIQACAFFRSVNWDELYRRSGPGPWVPPPEKKKGGGGEIQEGKRASPALSGVPEDGDHDDDEEDLTGFDGRGCSGNPPLLPPFPRPLRLFDSLQRRRQSSRKP
jgi:serine/threonine protein kinase